MIRAIEQRASDIHLTIGIPPVFRIDGQLIKNQEAPLTSSDIENIIKSITTNKLKEQLEKSGEVDFNYEMPGQSRFRVNAYKQKSHYTVALRLIPMDIPTLQTLQIGFIAEQLAEKRQGLVLVTGPTGSGKSTTLAAMIDHLNQTASKHIITLEDPIEFMHEHKCSVINQRAVGEDTKTFASGLRAALRQDPDVILVGEMRDLETISTAITAAETGHLVLATLHTSTAASTIDRVIDVFPPEQQQQVRQQLANTIEGIIAQRLLKRKGGKGRIAATEIMVRTPSISNLIRSEKVYQIPNVLQTSKSVGMHTMEMDIKRLLDEGFIDFEQARQYIGEY